ncbi:basic region leucine zipper [Teladorsagia circumcincta]|uniref:Basic region leucine zipper n=1 Tax=Teladorsagia circumcincta TaxID=45464 RepID=A0A2G9UYK0_TELCI|nr:basic region leucine zipper [Teladorsagia circumcincta]
MLSRFTRMSSLGAHLVSGCTALRDPPTAPKPIAKLESSGRSCTFVSPKESSSGSPDPFLWHEHENFLAELSELDHLKSDLSPRTSPERQSSTLDDSAEWSSILHSMEWIDKFEALDIPKIDSDCSTDYPESTSQDETSDFLDKTASLIDWKAWDCYLGVDDDLSLDVKCENKPADAEHHEEIDQIRDVKVKEEGDSLHPCEQKPKNLVFCNSLNEIERAIVRSSGPLTWLPSVREDDQCSELSSYSTPSSLSLDVASQVRTLKRRGVKMKPPSDDETNHRRWLNREAAFRYRERKRMEQLERKKELEDLTYRNKLLKQQVRELSREVALWREKLDIANFV